MGNKNEVMVFNNEMFGKVRVINIDGEGWLVGKDVAEILGYKNLSDSLSKHVDEEDKLQIAKHDLQNYDDIGTKGAIVINESGLYSLVLRSKLPQAKKFRRWVTSEVLPQIRQTGGYIPIKEEDDELTIMSKAFMIAQKTIDNKQQQIEQQQQLIEQQQEVIEQRQEVIELQQEVINNQQEVIKSQRDKVDFANTVSESEDDEIDMGTMAKLLAKEGIKIGRNRLFKILIELNILMDDNLPYQKFIDNRYFRVIKCRKYNKWDNKPKFYEKTLIKGKGQIYVTKKVKEYFENKNKENNK